MATLAAGSRGRRAGAASESQRGQMSVVVVDRTQATYKGGQRKQDRPSSGWSRERERMGGVSGVWTLCGASQLQLAPSSVSCDSLVDPPPTGVDTGLDARLWGGKREGALLCESAAAALSPFDSRCSSPGGRLRGRVR